jgi:tetratricopeptide (TPR) repeat protein/tRNA A-37 threonylcarbamoyl transferase component Bud32
MSEAVLKTEVEPSAQLYAGKYRVEGKLGEGGMGVVYRATEVSTQRVVALKQLLSSTAGAKRNSAEALFEREYHTLVRLEHPRIIQVYDYGLTEDGPFYTMELLDGQDLVKAAPLPYPEVCKVLCDILSSLALVHAHRWVHRDVSPRNVRLTPGGRAKLIDFGALASFGAHADVIGTPTCMAPEIFHCRTLDQRTDLFAVGAVAYWALTRRHAYPARRLSELTAAWRLPPVPPSEFVSGIPPVLDALVLSLLSLDPMARPENAAVVIDELSAIAGLPLEAHAQAAQHYLHSGRFVGRSVELEFAERALARVLRGTGAELLVDGPFGIGKSRLLQEVALEAQLKGLVVLKADAQVHPEPFGLAVALALHMLRAHPELARSTAEAHAGTLSQLSSVLHRELGSPALAPASHDHAERRARAQTALHEWFIAFARREPLLLAIDNLQAAEDNSAAFLAALGRKVKHERMVILATQRSGDAVVSPMALKALRKRSSNIKLGALSQDSCEQLVLSLFGEVDNVRRLGSLLFLRSAGNPQHCMDLAQLLVKKEIAKYVAGTWVLPFSVSDDELPSRAEEVALLRIADLSLSSRKLAEALSVYDKPVSLDKCLGLVPDTSEQDTFRALDELVQEQILLAEEAQYRFAHQALRNAFLMHMSDAARRELHARAAETLLKSSELGIGQRIEAALHLMRAGNEARGADLMAAAGREFLRNQSMTESPREVVTAMHTAAMVYEKQRRSEHELATLLFPLVSFGFHLDWQLTLKYAERAVDLGLRITGLGLAHKLAPLLGKKLGMKLAMWLAARRFKREQAGGLNYDLKQAIGSLIALMPAAVSTHAICYDIETVRRLVKKLTPMRLFGPGHLGTLFHDFVNTALLMSESRELEARAAIEKLLAEFQAPHVKAALGEGHFKSIFGGVLNSLGVLYPYEFGDKALAVAEQMEALGVRIWAMNADQIRLLHHALRGESAQIRHYRERVELYAVQGSTSWQNEVFWPVLLLTCDALAGDTIGVRRLSEQLARRSREVPGLKLYADAAHAIYLSMRGSLREAIAEFERIIPELVPRKRVAWHTVRALYADALTRAGRPGRAKEVVSEVLAQAIPGEDAIVVRFLEPLRQLALAEAALGNHARAVQILDDVLVRYEGQDNHLLLGLLHKARAVVAHKQGDRARTEQELALMEKQFRATQNPAAIAQWERLSERLLRSERSQARLQEARAGDDARSVLTQKIHSELCAADDPFTCALSLVLARSKAKSAFLYLLREDGLALVAASSSLEPPREIELALRSDLERATRTAEKRAQNREPDKESDDGERTVTVDTSGQPFSATHQMLLLTTNLGGEAVPVGGLIVERSAAFAAVDASFAEAIAAGLGDLMIKTATSF